MVALMHLEEAYEREASLSAGELDTRRPRRDVSSRTRHAERARFDRRRGGRSSLVNGAHRRRDKRNYLQLRSAP